MKHLSEVGETYQEHGAAALRMAWCCLKAAGYFVVHAVSPESYKNEGGDKVLALASYIKERRSKPLRRRKWRDKNSI